MDLGPIERRGLEAVSAPRKGGKSLRRPRGLRSAPMLLDVVQRTLPVPGHTGFTSVSARRYDLLGSLLGALLCWCPIANRSVVLELDDMRYVEATSAALAAWEDLGMDDIGEPKLRTRCELGRL